jgi:integrase
LEASPLELLRTALPTVLGPRRFLASGGPDLVHDLRHQAASLMLASGSDLRTVMGRLGHSQIALTGQIPTRTSHGLEAYEGHRRVATAIIVRRLD